MGQGWEEVGRRGRKGYKERERVGERTGMEVSESEN